MNNNKRKWNRTADSINFFGIPVGAFIPFIPAMFLPNRYTLGLALFVALFFAYLAHKGWNLNTFVGIIRHRGYRGRTAYARPWWYRNRMNKRHRQQ